MPRRRATTASRTALRRTLTVVGPSAARVPTASSAQWAPTVNITSVRAARVLCTRASMECGTDMSLTLTAVALDSFGLDLVALGAATASSVLQWLIVPTPSAWPRSAPWHRATTASRTALRRTSTAAAQRHAHAAHKGSIAALPPTVRRIASLPIAYLCIDE